MSKVEGWPEQPFQLISSTSCHIHAPALPKAHHAVRVAQLMALTHNTIFRAFNAIYHQARAIDPSNNRDVTDFVTFATFAVAFLDNHHQCEELIFFPMLEAQSKSPGLMATNVCQHRAFDASLRALRQCLKDVRTATAPFNASELRARIDELAMPLERHLRDEIPSLLEVGQRVGDQTMRVCYKALHDEAEGTTDPFKIGPLVLGCQDRQFLLDGQHIQFPELPFALVPYLVDHIVSRRYAGAWRFCPSTFHGEPRATEFFQMMKKTPSKDALVMQAAMTTSIARARRQFLMERVAVPIGVLLLLFFIAAVAHFTGKWWIYKF